MGIWQVWPPVFVITGLFTFYRVWIRYGYEHIFQQPRKLFLDDWLLSEDMREEQRWHWNQKKIESAERQRKRFQLE